MNDKKEKVKFKVGCIIPILALLGLLVVLEIIKYKTALIIGLSILIIPLIIWLFIAILLLIVGAMSIFNK